MREIFVQIGTAARVAPTKDDPKDERPLKKKGTLKRYRLASLQSGGVSFVAWKKREKGKPK